MPSSSALFRLFLQGCRRLGLGLVLLVGLCLALGVPAHSAHAQTTLTVTDCSSESQLQADVSTANSDNANDTITFTCSGDIKLSNTLTISGKMTLDGNGQSVTLDGGNSVQVLSVNSGVSFTLNALTVAHGAVLVNGGGLLNLGGTVSISNSTFANNSSSNFGGGLTNFEGTVSISNSTFTGNSASESGVGQGGGLTNIRGTVSISNSTFANNTSGVAQGGGLANEEGTVSIGGSIVANNTGFNCSGVASSQGYNLSSDFSCGFTGTGDLQNTNPQLDTSGLQNNGGLTQTIALQSSSPAIDQIPAAQCPATDQRGWSRPDDTESTCDIGAYESGARDGTAPTLSLPSTITVDATSPQGAIVNYTVTATDPDNLSSQLMISCSPTSGSTFAIGTTTVNCTATDPSGNSSSGSFQVVVKGAAAQVNDLVSLVNSFHLSSSLQNALDNKLKDVLAAINAGQTATACSELSDFIGIVQSHTGTGINQDQANQLIAAAQQVQAVLGC